MEPILFDFKHKGIIQYGDFVLKSGQKSDIYIDCRRMFENPDMLESVAGYMLEVAPSEFDYVCGVPYGAVPLATIISVQSEKPLIMLRKERKEHGTKNILEGIDIKKITPESRCLLVEDVVTTGSSINNAINQLVKNSPFVYENILPLAVFNRGIEPIPHLWSLADIAPKRLCVAIDMPSIDKSTHLTEDIHEYVDIVKVYHDAFINTARPKAIFKELKKKYNFKVVADRKFADTANTCILQYKSGKFNEWADYVTVRAIAGESTFKGLTHLNGDIKMLVVWTITSSDTPVGEYQINIIKLINKYRYNVAGVITREGELFIEMWKKWGKGPRPEIWAPGINMYNSTDGMGQTWTGIEDIVADVFIVESGIWDNPNPVEIARKYKKSIDVYNGKSSSGTGLFISTKGMPRLRVKEVV